jgi:D-alanyl-lipoteichoic acid acyltransferase DltB (MBOAT superfamily)
LYIAGPIISFNAFTSQLIAPAAAAARPRAAAAYLLRALLCWATLEALTHVLWFYSVSRHRLWEALEAAEGAPLRPLDMVLAPWWMMILVWSKFLVIWRFFRWEG